MDKVFLAIIIIISLNSLAIVLSISAVVRQLDEIKKLIEHTNDRE